MSGPLDKLETPAWVVLFVAVFSFAAWLRITNPPVAARSPDERCYMNYARLAVEQPLTSPRDMVSRYNRNPADWTYPIPLRIGYTYLLASVIDLFRLTPERAGVAVSTGSSILEFAMVALFGLRFFNRWTVLAALALLSVCPQDLAVARRVLGDGASGCAAMIFLWLCAEISIRPRARLWYTALWLVGAFLLLLKESGVFFLGFCVLGLAVQSWRRSRSWKPAAWIFAGAALTGICSFALMAVLCGGTAAALDTVRHSAQAAPANPYGALYQSGPWYSFPLGLWVLSPLTASGCGVGLIALILPRDSLGDVLSLDRRQRDFALGIGALIVLVLIAATLPPALKNLRYISFIVGPWYLMAALGWTYITVRLTNALGPRARAPVLALAACVLLLSCWSDFSRYCDLFLSRAVPDLNIRQVVESPFEQGS
jgi:hypothetical protein